MPKVIRMSYSKKIDCLILYVRYFNNPNYDHLQVQISIARKETTKTISIKSSKPMKKPFTSGKLLPNIKSTQKYCLDEKSHATN